MRLVNGISELVAELLENGVDTSMVLCRSEVADDPFETAKQRMSAR